MKIVVGELHNVLESAYRSSFRILRTTKKTMPQFPGGKKDLLSYAQRCSYQRTRGNNDLRDQRKAQYLAMKAEYATTIRKERSTCWNEFCNMTSTTNPWNEIYRIAAG